MKNIIIKNLKIRKKKDFEDLLSLWPLQIRAFSCQVHLSSSTPAAITTFSLFLFSLFSVPHVQSVIFLKTSYSVTA